MKMKLTIATLSVMSLTSCLFQLDPNTLYRCDDAGVCPGDQMCIAGFCQPADAGRADAGSGDAGRADAGSADAGSADAGSTDAGSTDAGSTDAGSTDAGSADAGFVDGGPVVITPAGPVLVAPGDSLQFTANVSVIWSVREGLDGGTIADSGVYVASQVNGTYHVVATPISASFRGAEAAVQVSPYVEVAAGAIGGHGYVDGVGTAARFSGAQGLATDGVALYVSDTQNDSMRALRFSDGTVTTLAGMIGKHSYANGVGPAAGFSIPVGIARVGQTLYIADSANSVVRALDLSTSTASLVCGIQGVPGTRDGACAGAGFTQPGALASDGAGHLWISDTADHVIRRLDIAAGTVTTVAGGAGISGALNATGTAARFNTPRGIAIDSSGLIYVSDSSNHSIRLLDPDSGVVTTYAGALGVGGSADGTTAVARFLVPGGVVADGKGALFVADSFNHTLRRIDLDAGTVSTVAGVAGMAGTVDGTGVTARLADPVALTLDPLGMLYVTDSQGSTVRKFDTATHALSTIGGAPPMYGTTDATGLAARLAAPYGITAVGTSSLSIADFGNRSLRVLSLPSGDVSTIVGAGFGFGVAAGPGQTFFSGTIDSTVVKVSAAATFPMATVIAGVPDAPGFMDGPVSTAKFQRPIGVVAMSSQQVLVTDPSNCVLRLVDATNVSTVAGVPGDCTLRDGPGIDAGFRSPQGLSVIDGGLFVQDLDALRFIDATYFVKTLATGLGECDAVTDDGRGGYLVACSGDGTIKRVSQPFGPTNHGQVVVGVPFNRQVVTGVVPGGLNSPKGIVRLPSGDVYVTDFVENAVLRIRGL